MRLMVVMMGVSKRIPGGKNRRHARQERFPFAVCRRVRYSLEASGETKTR